MNVAEPTGKKGIPVAVLGHTHEKIIAILWYKSSPETGQELLVFRFAFLDTTKHFEMAMQPHLDSQERRREVNGSQHDCL